MKLKLYKTLFNNAYILLRPIIRILVNIGIDFKTFSKVSKKIFIDVALNDFAFNNNKSNITRTSILTGIDRDEVKELFSQIKNTKDSERNDYQLHSQLIEALGNLLQAWHVNPSYLNNNKPMNLSLDSNKKISFDKLVQEYGEGFTSDVLLKELLKADAVNLHDNNIQVLTRYYAPPSNAPEHIVILTDALTDISNTLYHNLNKNEGQSSKFERRACSDYISVKNIPAFQEFIKIEGHKFIYKVDDWLTEHESHENLDEDKRRVGLGMYLVDSKI